MDSGLKAPCLIQSTFEISGQPTDTYLDVSSWHKGIVFINGFNIGRYFKVGPYRNLYVPAPLLKTGLNTVSAKGRVSQEFHWIAATKYFFFRAADKLIH